MKISTSTCDFRDFCGNDQITAIRYLYDAGFRYIDLSMAMVEEEDALICREDWQETAGKIKEFAHSMGMEFVQAHSPIFVKFADGKRRYFNPFDSEEDRELFLKYNTQAIRVCKELGIPNIVVHSAATRSPGKESFLMENGALYRELLSAVEDCGVNVLTENVSKADLLASERSRDKYQPTTGAEMRELIEYVDHPLFHACWDTAHRSMDGGNQYEDLMAIGEHLYALHLADNMGAGHGHDHVIPFCGVVNFDDIMSGLRDCGYKGCFNFEATYTIKPAGWRRTFEGDLRLRQHPLELEMAMEQYKYQVGKYILESYGCFED